MYTDEEFRGIIDGLSPYLKAMVGAQTVSIDLVKKAMEDGLHPDRYTDVMHEISAYSHREWWGGGREIARLMIDSGTDLDCGGGSLMMDNAARLGDSEILGLIFDHRKPGPVGERIFKVMKTHRIVSDGDGTNKKIVDKGNPEILRMIRDYRRKVKNMGRTNEGLRDKMTPKSKEDLLYLFSELLNRESFGLLVNFESNSPIFHNINLITKNLGKYY